MRGEGGGETLKKTKRTVIRCPRRRRQGAGCVLSVILMKPAPPPPAPLQGSSTETRERRPRGLGQCAALQGLPARGTGRGGDAQCPWGAHQLRVRTGHPQGKDKVYV